MAIRLASAIGEQRSVKPFEGFGDAITKAAGGVGDALAKKKAEEIKNAQLKDAYMKLIKVEAPTGTAEQKAEYENFGKNIVAKLMIMRDDKKVPAGAFEKAAKEAQYGLDERAVKMKEDWDWLSKVSDPKFREEYDTKSFEDWMIGKGSSSQVAEMEGDDFMAASTKNRAGKTPSEQGGMQATPTETQFTGDYYLKLPFEEQKKFNLREVGTKLVTPINPGLEKAAKGYFGESLDFGAFTTKKQNEKGGLEYSVDESGIDKEARKFAASVLGDGNFGSKEHRLYQKYLERIAIQKGTEAGLSGDKLAKFVEDSVEKVAYDDFVRNARAASEKRMKNEKEDPLRREGKDIVMNFTSGGGASKGNVTIEPVKDFTPSDKAGIEIAEKQMSELKESIKKANEIVEKYKNNTSSPAYQNAKKSLDASRKALVDLEEENLSREKGFLMFSNKKAVDDAFIDINNDGKTMYRVIGFKPKEGGGYEVLGVERNNTDDGKVDKIKNMELTESVYRKIIAENPDADDVMNKLGVKPKSETKAAAKTDLKGKKYAGLDANGNPIFK